MATLKIFLFKGKVNELINESRSSLKIALHFLVSSEVELELAILLQTGTKYCNQIIFMMSVYEMFAFSPLIL